MKYMLLIYDNENARTDADESMEPWIAYTQAAQEAGVYEAGAGLLPTQTATTVREREGEQMITDGPFAETKEQLGGFYILNCADLDEAIAWAGKIPLVDRGSVEVRPVLEPPEA